MIRVTIVAAGTVPIVSMVIRIAVAKRVATTTTKMTIVITILLETGTKQ